MRIKLVCRNFKKLKITQAVKGVANGKCKTLQDVETSFFYESPIRFDFLDYVLRQAWDVQTLKIRAPDLVDRYENELE